MSVVVCCVVWVWCGRSYLIEPVLNKGIILNLRSKFVTKIGNKKRKVLTSAFAVWRDEPPHPRPSKVGIDPNVSHIPFLTKYDIINRFILCLNKEMLNLLVCQISFSSCFSLLASWRLAVLPKETEGVPIPFARILRTNRVFCTPPLSLFPSQLPSWSHP